MINLFLGVVLLIFSEPVVAFFKLPPSETKFYPNILGAVLFGVGIALLIECRRKGRFIGLGLGGAISINLAGGIVLFIWIISGKLRIPFHGLAILWILDGLLLAISSFELIIYFRNRSENSLNS
jgi:hypothetical protein